MIATLKKSSILIMILTMTIRFVLAQQGKNLVQNGTFEQGNVGFRSDFRFSHEAFVDNVMLSAGYLLTSPIVHGNYYITDNFPYQENPIFNHIDAGSYDSLGRLEGLGRADSPFRLLQTAVNPKGPSAGYFLAVNINRSGKQRIWYDSITIKPNTTYSFSCILANVSTLPRVFSVDPPFIRDARPEHSFVENPGILKLCINGKKVSRALMLTSFSEWRTLSGKFTSGPDQTRIEIAIQDMMSPIFNNLVAVDNIVFKEIQAGEFVKKEDRFSKLGVKGGVVYYKKEEPPIEIPPVKKEEPIAVITSPVKKEEAVIEIPSPKEEEPVVETPPVKEEEPVVEILSKKEPSVVIPPKPKPLIVVPSKPLAIVHPPKPKPPIVIRPKAKSSVLVPSIPVKKDTASKIVAVSTDFKKDISIDEIKVDQKLQLSHIYFERAKYNLLTTSFPELNDMVTFMKRYPTVRIRLEGHTDNQGNPQLNLELSENRAKEVKKYLVDLGIDENRIEWIGYGGQRPIDSNPTADENLRPKNRRVEVVIISK